MARELEGGNSSHQKPMGIYQENNPNIVDAEIVDETSYPPKASKDLVVSNFSPLVPGGELDALEGIVVGPQNAVEPYQHPTELVQQRPPENPLLPAKEALFYVATNKLGVGEGVDDNVVYKNYDDTVHIRTRSGGEQKYSVAQQGAYLNVSNPTSGFEAHIEEPYLGRTKVEISWMDKHAKQTGYVKLHTEPGQQDVMQVDEIAKEQWAAHQARWEERAGGPPLPEYTRGRWVEENPPTRNMTYSETVDLINNLKYARPDSEMTKRFGPYREQHEKIKEFAKLAPIEQSEVLLITDKNGFITGSTKVHTLHEKDELTEDAIHASEAAKRALLQRYPNQFSREMFLNPENAKLAKSKDEGNKGLLGKIRSRTHDRRELPPAQTIDPTKQILVNGIPHNRNPQEEKKPFWKKQ